jgi:hypothetical protein
MIDRTLYMPRRAVYSGANEVTVNTQFDVLFSGQIVCIDPCWDNRGIFTVSDPASVDYN